MANTVNENLNAIIAEKDATPELDGLTNNSSTSVWRLKAFIAAVIQTITETLWDVFKAEIEAKLEVIPSNGKSLAAESKKFQFGDLLQFNLDGTYGYAEVDEEKQIIKRVAITSTIGGTQVKVAGELNGNPEELSNEELTSFQGYLNEIQFAEKRYVAVSAPSDKLKTPLTVYYNAIHPKATIQANVESAVNAFIGNLNEELNFDGSFLVLDLLIAVRNVTGVVNVTNEGIEARADAGDFTEVDRIYNPVSGYYEIDPAFSLANTIQYSAQ